MTRGAQVVYTRTDTGTITATDEGCCDEEAEVELCFVDTTITAKLKPQDTAFANGWYLCAGGEQEIEFKIPDQDGCAGTITWSATPAEAGSFTSATTGKKKVKWEQDQEYTSSSTDDVMIKAYIDGVSCMTFRFDIIQWNGDTVYVCVGGDGVGSLITPFSGVGTPDEATATASALSALGLGSSGDRWLIRWYPGYSGTLPDTVGDLLVNAAVSAEGQRLRYAVSAEDDAATGEYIIYPSWEPYSAYVHQEHLVIKEVWDVEIVEINGEAPPAGFAGRTYMQKRSVQKPDGAAPEVLLRATVDPPIAGITVHWSFEDPDEPGGAVPDDDDMDGGDNRGTGAGFNGNATRTSVTGADGKADCTFTLTTYGGDNFIVVAACSAGGVAEAPSEVMTVWKKLSYEGPEKLAAGAPALPDISTQLAQVYVEMEFTPNTADTIPTTAPGLTTVNGYTYGPYTSDDKSDLAFFEDINDEPGADLGVLIVNAPRQLGDMIDPANGATVPFDGTVANYSFVNHGDTSDDFATIETWWAGETVLDAWMFLAYDVSLLLHKAYKTLEPGLTWDQFWTFLFWHETTHVLGLKHTDSENQTDDIAAGLISTQQGWVDGAKQANDCQWRNTGAKKVRKDYVPNAQ